MKTDHPWILLWILFVILGACSTTEEVVEEHEGIWDGYEIEGASGQWVFYIGNGRIESRGQNPVDWFKGTYTLHETRGDIKTADILIEDCGVPQCKGMSCHAIYQRHRNRLSLALSIPGSPEKPTHFHPEPGIRIFVLFKRE